MKTKFQRKNIKAVKTQVTDIAVAYGCSMKWKVDRNWPIIHVIFKKKLGGEKYKKYVKLPEDKIAYGKYKPSMVWYNVNQQIDSWINRIYDEVYPRTNKTSKKVSKTH